MEKPTNTNPCHIKYIKKGAITSKMVSLDHAKKEYSKTGPKTAQSFLQDYWEQPILKQKNGFDYIAIKFCDILSTSCNHI